MGRQKEGLRLHPVPSVQLDDGPRLDNLNAARNGNSMAITQLILEHGEGSPIKLIEGGKQKRCFTDISDGIEALFRIIENKR